MNKVPIIALNARYVANRIIGHLTHGAGAYGTTLRDLLARGKHSMQDISPAVDFLTQALILDPDQRWSARQLLQHPWLEDVN